MFRAKPDTLSIEELRRIVVPIAEQNGITRVRLFGSRARGDFDKDSDYDFLIDVGPGVGLLQIGCFIEDLEEVLGKPVNLVDEVMISDIFMRSIQPDLREIYD